MRHRYSWLIPDLALVLSAIALFYCLFLFQGYQQLFRDSDAGWHIRAGEAMLASGRLPHTDPYSFTKAGRPWFAWEWASDATVGAIHRAGGLRGVALFYGVAIAAGVWLWLRLHWMMGGNFLIAAAMSPLLLSTCSIHWLARPHVLAWLLLLALMWWCERGGPWWVAGLIALVWANVHASFFLAPVMVGVYGVFRGLGLDAETLRRGEMRNSPPRRRGAEGFEDGGTERGSGRSSLRQATEGAEGAEGRWRHWILAFGAVLLASLINPYGWRLHWHVYRYLTDSELLKQIGEFQTFDFHAIGSGQIIATVMVVVAGGTLALVLGRLHHFVLAMVFAAMALRSARGLPLAALVGLPIANSAIAAMLPFRPFLAYGDRLRAIDARLGGLALAPLAVVAAWAGLRMLPAGFAPDVFPVAAYSHLAPEGRLFAPDKFGGYLIYRSNGARKVYFDGRSDFYGAEFLKEYGRLVQVRPGWQESWRSYGFTQALLPVDAPLAAALEAAGWRTVYRDSTVTILNPGGT